MSDRFRIHRLDWDSGFFGIRVGQLHARGASADRLHGVLASASRDYDLVYLRDADPGLMTAELLRTHRGQHVDSRAEFEAAPVVVPPEGDPESRGRIRPFGPDEDCSDLVALAPQAATYSRFRRDARFPAEWVDRLYRTWIERSVARALADRVLVAEIEGRIVGFHAIRVEGRTGRLTLFAVDAAARGRGLGAALLRAGLEWIQAQGLSSARVATQIENPVCRLYERSGYSLVGREEIYHFWLDPSIPVARSSDLS